VNPKQFAAHEDLDTYPRQWETDLDALTACGVDLVFAPSAQDVYPPATSPQLSPFVDLAAADTVGEGRARPGFFRGVATVLTKLLNITQPTALYMGQKDGMQCIVARRLIQDLNYPVTLIVGPTLREEDGLAMSSRNVYLTPQQRAAAPAVYRALQAVEAAHAQGQRSVARLRASAAAVVATEPLLELEYLSLACMHDAAEFESELRAGAIRGQPADGVADVLASIAVRAGGTRLIDNVVLSDDEAPARQAPAR